MSFGGGEEDRKEEKNKTKNKNKNKKNEITITKVTYHETTKEKKEREKYKEFIASVTWKKASPNAPQRFWYSMQSKLIDFVDMISLPTGTPYEKCNADRFVPDAQIVSTWIQYLTPEEKKDQDITDFALTRCRQDNSSVDMKPRKHDNDCETSVLDRIILNYSQQRLHRIFLDLVLVYKPYCFFMEDPFHLNPGGNLSYCFAMEYIEEFTNKGDQSDLLYDNVWFSIENTRKRLFPRTRKIDYLFGQVHDEDED